MRARLVPVVIIGTSLAFLCATPSAWSRRPRQDQPQEEQAPRSQAFERLQSERHGLALRVEVLERALRDAREANEQLQRDLAARSEENRAADAFRERVVRQLALREAELQQTEAIVGALEHPSAPAPSAGVPESDTTPAHRHPVTVFQVNDEMQFLVLSVAASETLPSKQVLVLETAQAEPLATVQLAERDAIGFVIAPILKRLDRHRQIRKGDALFLRPLG